MDSRVSLGSCAAALLAGVGPAGAQEWRAVVLHSEAPNSFAAAESGVNQAGYGTSGPGTNFPVLWQGGSTVGQSLLPAGFDAGSINGMSASQQVGQVNVAGSPSHAALWSGTAASFVDLHSGPQGSASAAFAISAGQQVGVYYASAGGPQQAAFWLGTPLSFVNLHPAGATSSAAWAADGGRQGGFVFYQATGVSHAALWVGNPGSFRDMDPSGPTSPNISFIRGMAAGVQVGDGHIPGLPNRRAIAWFGGATEYIDLSPPGATDSALFATNGLRHVGDVQSRARLWMSNHGTDTVDLHAFLPAGYTGSSARGVYEANGHLWVAGFASRAGGYDAILWTNSCYANCDGSATPPTLNVNDFNCFINRFAAGDGYANCDGSTTPPVLNTLDFVCFLNAFVAGCS